MKKTSPDIFTICFIICLFAWPVYNLIQLGKIRFDVIDRSTMEVHRTFDNKWDAVKYINDYREFHDYIIQEVKNVDQVNLNLQ